MNNTKTPGQVAYEAFFHESGDRLRSVGPNRERWESAAAAVITHHEASKQTRPKFRVGDRVRRIANDQPWAPVGYIATVTRGAYKDGLAYIDKDGDTTAMYVEEWEKVEWTLPSPPPGLSWHRTGWTEEMLPDGWRPLTSEEHVQEGDQINYEANPCDECNWTTYTGNPWRNPAKLEDGWLLRTRRPLPPAAPSHEIKITLPSLTLTHGSHSLASQEVAV